jgi:hypothetical protein
VADVPIRLGAPRFALFGLVGGPLVSIVGVLVILDVVAAEGPVQVLVAPEFIWELGIGIYLIVKGYRTSSPALAGTQSASAATAGDLRHERRRSSPHVNNPRGQYSQTRSDRCGALGPPRAIRISDRRLVSR